MVDFSKLLKGNKMTNESFNMDALLDGTLDDLADIPEYKPYPRGAHICTLKVAQKKINDFPAFEVGLKLISTEQLSDSNDTPLEAGAEANVAYFMKHKDDFVAQMGQGKFKELMKAAAAHFGEKTNRELIEDCQGATVLVTTSIRENKDKTKKFTDIETVKFI